MREFPAVRGYLAQGVLRLLEQHGTLTNREMLARWAGEKPSLSSLQITVHRLKDRGFLDFKPTKPGPGGRYKLKVDPRQVPPYEAQSRRLGAAAERNAIVTWLPLGSGWRAGDPVVFLNVEDWDWSHRTRWRRAPEGHVEHDGQIEGIRFHYLVADAGAQHEVRFLDGDPLNCCRWNLKKQRRVEV